MKWDKVESSERAEDAVIHAQIAAPSLDTRKCHTLRLLMNVDYQIIDVIGIHPTRKDGEGGFDFIEILSIGSGPFAARVCMTKQTNTANQVAVTNSTFLFFQSFVCQEWQRLII